MMQRKKRLAGRFGMAIGTRIAAFFASWNLAMDVVKPA